MTGFRDICLYHVKIDMPVDTNLPNSIALHAHLAQCYYLLVIGGTNFSLMNERYILWVFIFTFVIQLTNSQKIKNPQEIPTYTVNQRHGWSKGKSVPIRFIANNEISPIWCIVGMKRGAKYIYNREVLLYVLNKKTYMYSPIRICSFWKDNFHFAFTAVRAWTL